MLQKETNNKHDIFKRVADTMLNEKDTLNDLQLK